MHIHHACTTNVTINVTDPVCKIALGGHLKHVPTADGRWNMSKDIGLNSRLAMVQQSAYRVTSKRKAAAQQQSSSQSTAPGVLCSFLQHLKRSLKNKMPSYSSKTIFRVFLPVQGWHAWTCHCSSPCSHNATVEVFRSGTNAAA